ncbi:hypothetical protein QYE76_020171 [Lolium multiflorum]|uniref:Uncharacterized protein n=1 Tax=Lolium multiflorum TaxID=4521 RepID=A0AAD8R7W3_LOLMU|nr:hypothetical protein QYE76_020171 [Lolium multiflorum]
MRLPDEDHQVMYGRLLIVADAFRLSGATHINDSWIKEKYIECMMPFVPIDVKTLVGRECYSSLSSQDAVHEMQALKVLEQNSHDSRNRAIGMAKGNNLALVVNPVEEVYPQEQYRASWSMSYPIDLECHYHDHMAFHAKSFWVDPSKAKEDNIKRNHKSGFTSFGPKTRSCYNCDDKRHFIAECPYENRELHNGRLIPKDKSKDTKGKYSKAPNKKFYNNKTKKGKRPPRVVLVTREEYSTDEVQSSSDDEGESSKEVAAIVTTNIPSSSLFESPNENPHNKNAHCFMAKSSLDTSIVLSTQEEYTSGDDDVDDEEDATSNGLVALAFLSTNSSSPSESPNEIIHVEEESCLMAKTSEVSSPSPSMPNISSDLGVDDASLKVKQEMLEFDEFILNLQGSSKKRNKAPVDEIEEEFEQTRPSKLTARQQSSQRQKTPVVRGKNIHVSVKNMQYLEYKEIRDLNPYLTSRNNRVTDKRFHNKTQEEIFYEVYVPFKKGVALQHAIDTGKMAASRYFDEAYAMCGEFGLYPIMELTKDYDVGLIHQFYATVHFDSDEAKTFRWMSHDKLLESNLAKFGSALGYPRLPGVDENGWRCHDSSFSRPREVLEPLYIKGWGIPGKSADLLPTWDIMLRVYRETIGPKGGNLDELHLYEVDLMANSFAKKGTGEKLDVMDYIYNEMWSCVMEKKLPSFALHYEAH